MKKINKRTYTPNMALYFALTVIIGCSIYLFSSSNGILGNDFWWHIKVGEWIIENHSIPTTDIFSWYGQSLNIPWTAHEWLSDVIYYYIYATTGEIGIFLLSVGAACAMIYLLWRAAKPYISQNIALGAIFFVCLSTVMPGYFYARPHLLSFLLLYALIWCLYRFYENDQSPSVYFIPLIACFWSNVHGGSSNLTYIVCLVFLAVGCMNFRIGAIEVNKLSRKALIKLSLITLASIGAILINPIGLKVLIYPYQSQTDSIMISLISEWQSPDAKQMGDLLFFFAPIVLMLIGFFAEEKKIRLIDLAVMGIFILLFLRSVRFIMLWYIVTPFCAFRYMPMLKVSELPRKIERTLVGLIIGTAILFVALSGKNAITAHKADTLISKVLSQEAIDAVKKDDPSRLYNDYNYGEALIYNDINTFYDARADLFVYDNIMADGAGLSMLSQINPDSETATFALEAVIRKYNFDAYLIARTRPLYVYLNSHPEKYQLVFEDEETAYFISKGDR